MAIILNTEILKDMRVRFDKYVHEHNNDPEVIFIAPQSGYGTITTEQLVAVESYVKDGGQLPCSVDGLNVSFADDAAIPEPPQVGEGPIKPPTALVSCDGEWYDEGCGYRKGYYAYINQLERNHGDYICAIVTCYHATYQLTGKDLSVNEMVDWAWNNVTNQNGTGHEGIKSILNHFAPELDIQWYRFTDITIDGIHAAIQNRCQAVIWHYLYQNKYGHYSDVLNACPIDNTLTIIGSLPSQAGKTMYEFGTVWNWTMGISQPGFAVITKSR